MNTIEVLCWLGIVITAAIIALGILGGIFACMLSSYISQELGEE